MTVSMSDPRSVLERLGGLRSQVQSQVDAVERLVEDLKASGTVLGSDLAPLLECLLADRFSPALQDLAALEETTRCGGGCQ